MKLLLVLLIVIAAIAVNIGETNALMKAPADRIRKAPADRYVDSDAEGEFTTVQKSTDYLSILP